MQFLQSIHLNIIEMIQRITSRLCGADCRVVGHLVINGFSANRVRFANGLLTLGCVDDQADFLILDHVDDMRPPFAHFIDAPTGDTACRERTRRTAGRNNFKTPRCKRFTKFDRRVLVTVLNTEERDAAVRQQPPR